MKDYKQPLRWNHIFICFIILLTVGMPVLAEENANTKSDLLVIIIALISGIFIGLIPSVVSIWTNKQSMKSNEKNLKAQLDHTKDMALLEFNRKHKQEWINNVMNCVSDFLTQETLMCLGQTAKPEDMKNISAPQLGLQADKILLCQYKMQLLLNPIEKEQKNLIDAINNLAPISIKEPFDIGGFRTAKSKTIDAARSLFQKYGEEIKNYPTK